MLLTPADGPLMAAAKACGIAVEPLTMRSLGGMARQVDLVHAHDARSHTWAAALASVPLVVSRRVGFPVGHSFLSRWKYGRANRYLAVSEHVKRTLVEAEIPENKISVVYDGVDLPEKLAAGVRIIAPVDQRHHERIRFGSRGREESRVSIYISPTICRPIFRPHRCSSISRGPRGSGRPRCLRWRTEYRWWPAAWADCRRSLAIARMGF